MVGILRSTTLGKELLNKVTYMFLIISAIFVTIRNIIGEILGEYERDNVGPLLF